MFGAPALDIDRSVTDYWIGLESARQVGRWFRSIGLDSAAMLARRVGLRMTASDRRTGYRELAVSLTLFLGG